MLSIFFSEPWWRTKAITKAWSSGPSLPSGETSNAPSRVSLQVGQAKRVTFSGCLQSGQRALEISIPISKNMQTIAKKIHKVKYKIKLIKLLGQIYSHSQVGAEMTSVRFRPQVSGAAE